MKAFLLSLLMIFATASFASPNQSSSQIHHQRKIVPHQHHHHHKHGAPHYQHRHHHRHVVPHHRRHLEHRRIIRRHPHRRHCPPAIIVPPAYDNCPSVGGQVFLNQGNISLGLRF